MTVVFITTMLTAHPSVVGNQEAIQELRQCYGPNTQEYNSKLEALNSSEKFDPDALIVLLKEMKAAYLADCVAKMPESLVG